VGGVAGDPDRDAVADGDPQRAGVGAVVRAGASDDGLGPGSRAIDGVGGHDHDVKLIVFMQEIPP
jgi:hypothetical protein